MSKTNFFDQLAAYATKLDGYLRNTNATITLIETTSPFLLLLRQERTGSNLRMHIPLYVDGGTGAWQVKGGMLGMTGLTQRGGESRVLKSL